MNTNRSTMVDAKKTVFIFKAASEELGKANDPYTYELEKHGFFARMICVLDFNFKNIDVLTRKLSQPDMYSGR